MFWEKKGHFLRKTENFHQVPLDKGIAMATPQVTVNWKLFQMMPYIFKLIVRTFHQPTANRFGTTGQKPVKGRGHSVKDVLNT